MVHDGSLGSDEITEFADEIVESKPVNATKWLLDYLPRVRCIYAFQLLSGTDYENGWEILGAVKNCVWSFAPSLMQADGEGFTNEDGYHILWQFSDSVKGEWWMGVIINGQWNHFKMDLGNRQHRDAFLQGQIPSGATRA